MSEDEDDLLTKQREQIEMLTRQIERQEMTIQNLFTKENNQSPKILIPPPRPLELFGDKAENLRIFRQGWANYLIAGGIEDKTEREKLATLYCVIGAAAIEYMTKLSITVDDNTTAQNILDALEEDFHPEINIIFERAIFNTAKQEAGESADAYVERLRGLLKMCCYESMEDEILRDRIVVSVWDRKLRKRLCENNKLTLDEAISQLKANEVEQRQLKELRNDSPDERYSDHYTKRRSRSGSRKRTRQRSSSSSSAKCLYCGQPRHKRDSCPAAFAICDVCQVRGHYSSVCHHVPTALITRR